MRAQCASRSSSKWPDRKTNLEANQSLLGDLKSRTAPWARSLARLERPADNREVASPNLAGPTLGQCAPKIRKSIRPDRKTARRQGKPTAPWHCPPACRTLTVRPLTLLIGS